MPIISISGRSTCYDWNHERSGACRVDGKSAEGTGTERATVCENFKKGHTIRPQPSESRLQFTIQLTPDIFQLQSQKLNGGTTVSATMLIASKAGIPIFVTGRLFSQFEYLINAMLLFAWYRLSKFSRQSYVFTCADEILRRFKNI